MASTLITTVDSTLDDVELMVKHAYVLNQKVFKQMRYSLRNLKTFVLIASRMDDEASLVSLLLRIGHIVSTYAHKIHPLCVDVKKDGVAYVHISIVSGFQKEIGSLEEEIREWYVRMLDATWRSSSPVITTAGDISEIITSILENLVGEFQGTILQEATKALGEQMRFLKSFICFVEPTQCLLAHAETAAVNSAFILLRCQRALDEVDIEMMKEIKLQISSLVRRVKPIDAQACEIYTQALHTSKLLNPLLASPAARERKNFSRTVISNLWELLRLNIDQVVSMEDQGNQMDNIEAFSAMAYFLDSLISNLWELLLMNNVHVVSMKDQLQELYQELRSLRIILKNQHNNFNVKIQKNIRAAVCDAGLLIFSLFKTNTEEHLRLGDLLETVKIILAEFGEKDSEAQMLDLPKTNQLGFIDFVLQKLMEHTSCESSNSQYVEAIHAGLSSLRSFMAKIVELRNQQDELQSLWDRVLEVAYKVEDLVDHLLVGDPANSFLPAFHSIMKEIGNIEPEIEFHKSGIEVKEKDQEIKANERIRTCQKVSSKTILPMASEVVGFVDEAESIMDQLTRGSNYLRIVSIVGMPGIGKTTLATKVYNHPLILSHFHVRAWSPVSQVVDKDKVLLELLNQIDPNNKCSDLPEQDLVERLYRNLKGRRYIIVLDDIWSIEDWTSLAGVFPDDNVRSRILLTSRRHDVAPHEMLINQESHFLRGLNAEESLELLQRKLFLKKDDWPPALHDLGMKMAGKCNGLPLMIIIVAGILATMEPDGWEKILDDLSSGDKAKDEHFLHFLKGYDELSAFCEPRNLRRLCIHSEVEHFKESKLFCPRARSLLFNASLKRKRYGQQPALQDISFMFEVFKLLRVLDLEQICLRYGFPSEMVLLVHVAFLAIRGWMTHIPSSIGNLLNLETLIVDPEYNTLLLPDSLWNLQKLKYVCIKGNGGSLPVENLNSSQVLSELHIFSGVVIPYCESMGRLMRKFANIRRLKCKIFHYKDDPVNLQKIAVPDFLSQLVSLHMSPYGVFSLPRTFELSLPANLKKLTLSKFYLSWRNLSTIGKLQNLEVLKLLHASFQEDTWEMEEGEFSKLRILKLSDVHFKSWEACDDQFECLQKLVLDNCRGLEEMPSCLENISKLETIEVSHCSQIVIELVRQIAEEQMNWGNSDLKVTIQSFDLISWK
ncbi:OLC1v1033764C1 [Oldenlandia corymbosa var. corymbosa]|uniref:OLC1v1033764C1 n=1 Tax=Oldenlandia corymbosa var. corymbosa TaxID=529605 RepID=A0AAV1CS67_OLDCO|nr:OLC1v1033764C1 [Oldenlandia corymbosa var. corymbosa]